MFAAYFEVKLIKSTHGRPSLFYQVSKPAYVTATPW